MSVDLRRILTAASIALIGIFVVTVVAQALPLQLLRPEWIQRTCASIIGGVSFPLIAMVFLLLSVEGTNDLNRAGPPAPEPRLITNLRILSWVVALGFVLMIPLQTWAGVKVLQAQIGAERQQLLPYQRALALIRLAETPDAVMFAISTLPGVPPDLAGAPRDPLPQVKQKLISQIEPQIKARQSQLNALNAERWQQAILTWVKQAFNAVFCAFAFGAIGRLGPTRESLVSGFLMPSDSQRQWKRAISSQKRTQNRRPWSKRSGPPGPA